MSDTIPVRADERFSLERVANFLCQSGLTQFEPSQLEVEQFPAGQSNLTYLLRAGEWEAVLRRPPLGPVAPRAHDMAREFHILQRLHPSFALAPEPYVLCEDLAVIGAPFYVMERRRGLVLDMDLPVDWTPDPVLHQAIAESIVRVLVELHAVDWRGAGLGEISHPDGYMLRQVSGWLERFARARTEDVRELGALSAWLVERLPESPPPTVIHNDYKLNNVLLDYADPRLDPQRVLQEFKRHPFIAKLLEGGKMIRYGAKSLPYGGWWAIPQVAGNGWMILGDSAGFLNSQRLKGIHLAIKSGMLAAETAFEALKKDDFSATTLRAFQQKVESSWIKEELWKVRNFHQGFEHGFWRGMFHAGIQQFTGGRGLRNRYPGIAGYTRMKRLSDLPADGGGEGHLLGTAKGDGKLTFDKLTDLYHSGTKHEEDQPAHLIIHDTDICNSRCIREYGSPCQNFCPANVYEMLDDSTAPNGKRISLNPSNCVHCKTCDIQDPYQIITWVSPEGGGGPNYDGM